MKTYIVHVSDAGVLDFQSPVEVAEDGSLGCIAQSALDEFQAQHGEEFRFPLFLDIHPADQYAELAWMRQSHRG